MGRCIIHAGMQRTGAKSLQHSLMGLDTAHAIYAPLAELPGFPNHTVTLRNLYTPPRDPRHQKLVRHYGRQEFGEMVELTRLTMKAALAIAGGRDFILSADGLMRLSTGTLTRMRAAMARHFDSFSVIGYVRPPHSFLESMVQQRIRDGQGCDIDLAALWPRYKAQVSRLDAVFTREEVALVTYDAARLAGGDVVTDFCARAGIALQSITPVRRNAAMTRVAAQLLYQYGLAVKAGQAQALGPRAAGAVADRLSALDPAPFRLALPMVEPVIDQHRDDLEWISRRMAGCFADARESDPRAIASLAELAEPVPDGERRIAALIEADGGTVGPGLRGSIPSLLKTLAETVQMRPAAVLRKTGGKGPPPAREEGMAESRAAGDPLPYKDMAVPRPARLPRTPLTLGPTPLVNPDKNLVVLWSPKSACTTVYVWFSHVSGFSADVRAYAHWPHRHRMEQFQKSKLYYDGIMSGMTDATVLKIIRDPYGRAVSIYRHALQSRFAEVEMEAWSGGTFDARRGYSFQTFLDLLETLDMRKVDVHFRPQLHPLEETRGISRLVNISKADMFQQLNAFEEEQGWPRTDFADLHWLHELEGKRKARQEPMAGDALDEVPFSRSQVKERGQFPHYAQLLTPRARRRIEAVYKADFDAYGQYL